MNLSQNSYQNIKEKKEPLNQKKELLQNKDNYQDKNKIGVSEIKNNINNINNNDKNKNTIGNCRRKKWKL